MKVTKIKNLREVSDAERSRLMSELGDLVAEALPDDAHFALVIFMPDGRGCYVGSGDTAATIEGVRMVLDQMERLGKGDDPR